MLHLASSWLAAVGLLALALTPSAPGEAPEVRDSTAEVKKALTEVIALQLTAFRNGDFAAAYTFAAGEIQAQFSAPAFEEMVKSAYPLIAHSGAADFGETVDNGEEAVVEVRIKGEGRSGLFRYRLHKEGGKWRITGVFEVKPLGLSV